MRRTARAWGSALCLIPGLGFVASSGSALCLNPPLFTPQKVVRGYNLACGFHFRKLEDGQVKISYIVHPEVGGWIPSSAVHKGTLNAVNDIVCGLVDFVAASE